MQSVNVECAMKDCSNASGKNSNKFLQCFGGCDRKFHWKCIGINAAIASGCKENDGLFWFCNDCRDNSVFRLHHKLDFVCDAVRNLRQQARRAEVNLDSKIATCYNMISSLAKITSIANERVYYHSCCKNISEASKKDTADSRIDRDIISITSDAASISSPPFRSSPI